MAVGGVTLRPGSGDEDMLAAAGVWARATNRRDAPASPRSAADVLDGVRDRAHDSRAVLMVAEHGAAVVGFCIALVERSRLELVYLATDPDAWGLGIASLLLREIDALAARQGASSMELWVLAGNDRAIAVYERAGWVRTDETRPHPTSSSTERRLVRVVPVDLSRTSVSPCT